MAKSEKVSTETDAKKITRLESAVAHFSEENAQLTKEVKRLTDELERKHSMLQYIKSVLLGAIVHWVNGPDAPQLLVDPKGMDASEIAEMLKKLFIDLIVTAGDQDSQLKSAKEQIIRFQQTLRIINKISTS